MRINGACHCGNIAFEAEVDPETVRICHCTDCQTMSGSLFRANIQAAGEHVPAGARHAENLRQDGRQREPAGAGVLSGLRHRVVGDVAHRSDQLWVTGRHDHPTGGVQAGVSDLVPVRIAVEVGGGWGGEAAGQ